MLQEYLRLRLELAAGPPLVEDMTAALGRSNDIQEQLWQKTIDIATENNAIVPTGLYISALNEMIDDQEKRLSAFRNRVPVIVICGLYGIAIIVVTFTGYAAGIEKQSSRLPCCVLSIVIASVLLLIQDVDRPTAGFMQVSQQPFLDTEASLQAYTHTNLQRNNQGDRENRE